MGAEELLKSKIATGTSPGAQMQFYLIFQPLCTTSQVNADVVNWLNLPNEKKIKISVKSASVGRCISTKALGSTERRDITHKYKYDEGNGSTTCWQSFLSTA